MDTLSSLVGNLTESQQKELGKFIEVEQQKAAFQAQVHEYTDICWDRCITKIKSTMDKSDQGDLSSPSSLNCL